MTRTQAVLKKAGALVSIAVGVTALSIASPAIDAGAAPKSTCIFGQSATAKPAPKSTSKGALKKALDSTLSAFGISAAGAAEACTFELEMGGWMGAQTGTVVSDGTQAALTITSPEFFSAAGAETVTYARGGCQDMDGFHVAKAELKVWSADLTQQITISASNLTLPAGMNYYTLLTANSTVTQQVGSDLSLRTNENGWATVSSANPGQFYASFHMQFTPTEAYIPPAL